MSLSDTPAAERPHIAFFGLRNAGKSSLVNAITGQDLAVVSEIAGVTTDPVSKTMELTPLGPVVIIDTPGIDDSGPLGEKRVQRAQAVLDKTDIAVLVVAAPLGLSAREQSLLELFQERKIPYLVAYNKADLGGQNQLAQSEQTLYVSALTGEGISALKERLARLERTRSETRPLVRDLLQSGDIVVLVTPIDAAAPKGRLILPQQMALRDILDAGAIPVLARETEYAAALAALAGEPRLVITDSKVFKQVRELSPGHVALTSFSILMARYKGFLAEAAAGARLLDHLQDDDNILISEACTHHRQCDDIGTVRLPRMLNAYTGCKLRFTFTSGGGFPSEPEALKAYRLIIHCGACMINAREMRARMRRAQEAGTPMTNYGVAMAQMNGILHRCLAPFAHEA